MVDANQQQYFNNENYLKNSLYENSRQYDSAILTLSSGLLTLSMAFIRDLALFDGARIFWVLIGSWCALGLAVISTVASFLTSAEAIHRDLYAMYTMQGGKSRWWHNRTRRLNLTSGALFLTGICLTITFVSVNLHTKGSIMDDKKDGTEQISEGYAQPQMNATDDDVEKGYVPPAPPPPPPVETPKDPPKETK